jgi:hypothetical protein
VPPIKQIRKDPQPIGCGSLNDYTVDSELGNFSRIGINSAKIIGKAVKISVSECISRVVHESSSAVLINHNIISQEIKGQNQRI